MTSNLNLPQRHTHPFVRRIRGVRSHNAKMAVRLWRLVKQPIFIWLTIFVHTAIIGSGVIFYALESGANLHMTSPFDGIYWAVATATTVGYGDVVAVTTYGRLLAMIMMVSGTVFSALYTALFAIAFIAPELREVERDVHFEDLSVNERNTRPPVSEDTVRELVTQLRQMIEKLKDS